MTSTGTSKSATQCRRTRRVPRGEPCKRDWQGLYCLLSLCCRTERLCASLKGRLHIPQGHDSDCSVEAKRKKERKKLTACEPLSAWLLPRCRELARTVACRRVFRGCRPRGTPLGTWWDVAPSLSLPAKQTVLLLSEKESLAFHSLRCRCCWNSIQPVATNEKG